MAPVTSSEVAAISNTTVTPVKTVAAVATMQRSRSSRVIPAATDSKTGKPALTTGPQLADRMSDLFSSPLSAPSRKSGVTSPREEAVAQEAPQSVEEPIKPPSVTEAIKVIRKTTRNSQRPEFLRESNNTEPKKEDATDLSLSNLPIPAASAQSPLISPSTATVKGGLPEEMIEKVLKGLAPDDLSTQLELLTDTLLKSYLECAPILFPPDAAYDELFSRRAASENPAEIVSHTSIPRPAFILARYLSTKAGKLEGDHIAAVPKVLDAYVSVWFLQLASLLSDC